VILSLPPGHLRFVTIITHHENVKKIKNKPLANDGTHPHKSFSKEKKKVPHISQKNFELKILYQMRLWNHL